MSGILLLRRLPGDKEHIRLLKVVASLGSLTSSMVTVGMTACARPARKTAIQQRPLRRTRRLILPFVLYPLAFRRSREVCKSEFNGIEKIWTGACVTRIGVMRQSTVYPKKYVLVALLNTRYVLDIQKRR
jgi:hypothetical protein